MVVGDKNILFKFAEATFIWQQSPSTDFYFNYHKSGGSSRPFSIAVSKCRNLEKAIAFLFDVIKLIVFMKRHLENNCPTANNSTCEATSKAYTKAVEELLSYDTPENFQQSLNDLFFDWIQSELSHDTSYRAEVTSRVLPIQEFFQNIKSI